MEGAGARGGVTVTQYDVEVGGGTKRVALTRSREGFAVTVDGRAVDVAVVSVDVHLVSLIVHTAQRADAAPPRRSSYELVIARSAGDDTMTITVDGVPVTVSVDPARRWRRGS